jgi:predicted anti-sigma-YlaC factor YlaD
MKLNLDCKEVSRLISHGLDADLPPDEKARLRLHFVICTTCRNVDEQMKFIRNALRQMGANDRPN